MYFKSVQLVTVIDEHVEDVYDVAMVLYVMVTRRDRSLTMPTIFMSIEFLFILLKKTRVHSKSVSVPVARY